MHVKVDLDSYFLTTLDLLDGMIVHGEPHIVKQQANLLYLCTSSSWCVTGGKGVTGKGVTSRM